MFDFHRFMLYNIFFYALKRLFENVVIAKSVPKLRIVLTIIKQNRKIIFSFSCFEQFLITDDTFSGLRGFERENRKLFDRKNV